MINFREEGVLQLQSSSFFSECVTFFVYQREKESYKIIPLVHWKRIIYL